MPLQRVCSRCPSSLPVIYTYKTCERCREARRKRPQLQLTPPSFLHYYANCKSYLPPTAFIRALLGKAPYTIYIECNKYRSRLIRTDNKNANARPVVTRRHGRQPLAEISVNVGIGPAPVLTETRHTRPLLTES